MSQGQDWVDDESMSSAETLARFEKLEVAGHDPDTFYVTSDGPNTSSGSLTVEGLTTTGIPVA